jgi:GDP-4-dehydro-6-deoxy-D-mannose reductase
MKVLVTGGGGFVGDHLIDSLMDKHKVIVYDLFNGDDVCDYEKLRITIERFQPDYIYHLAGQAYVPESAMDVKRGFDVMLYGAINLLNAVRHTGNRAKILLAGTSGEYGYELNADVLTEETCPNPDTPYGIAKLAATHIGMWYAKQYHMNVVVTRAFNHTGPGRPSNYADSSFARQVVLAERGLIPHIEHGNLQSVRNYTDVRDMVRAYERAIELPPAVYNLCSDQNVTMQHVMDLLVKNALKTVKTVCNDALYRPSTLDYVNPSCEKFKKLTGWEPEIPLEQTLNDLLDYWRSKL